VVLLAVISVTVFVRMRGRAANAEPVPVAQPATPAQEAPATPRPAAGIVFRGGSRTSANDQQAKTGPVKNAAEVNKISPAEEDTEVRTVNLGPATETAPAQPTMDEPLPPSGALSGGTHTTSEISSILAAPNSMPRMAMTVSQGVTGGRLTRRVDPVYPVEARQMRAEGPVVLRAKVSEDGTVHDVSIVKGNPLLARAAIEAVRKWRFEPFQLNHKPVAIQTDITVDFKLQ
jgi:TonB family protein